MLILIVCGGESMSQKKVALECTKCGAHNYTITANPQRQERLELKSFVNIVVNILFTVKPVS